MNFIFDSNRVDRIGMPEAIFCEGKDPKILNEMLSHLLTKDGSFFLTRLSEKIYSLLDKDLRSNLDYHTLSRTAVLTNRKRDESVVKFQGRSISIITAGTADLSVAWEAKRTLDFSGVHAEIIADVGVAGVWRLEAKLDEIREFNISIVCAGMEASLPTILGGLLSSPIIALPTSNGYGISEKGLPALYSLLASCAPGLSVVNIDNGYGAACAAIRMLSLVK